MNAAVTTELRTIGHWIGGQSAGGDSGRKGPVFNPATGEQTGEVAFASTEEMDRAVATATERKLTAAGGITTRAEIDALDALGIDAVVGMAIYTGSLALE